MFGLAALAGFFAFRTFKSASDRSVSSPPIQPAPYRRVITDLADLMQEEMRLARAELSEKFYCTVRNVAVSCRIIGQIVVLIPECWARLTGSHCTARPHLL